METKPVKISNGGVYNQETIKKGTDFSEANLIQIQQNGSTQCGLITFEEVGNYQPIPPQNLGFTTATFESDWTGVNEDSGNFSNEPSPVTIAFTFTNSSPNIFLSNPVSSASFYYAALYPLTVEVYDMNNTLLQLLTAPPNYQNGYTRWDPVTFNFGSNVIARIRIIGVADNFGIDNLQLCTTTLVRGIPFL